MTNFFSSLIICGLLVANASHAQTGEVSCDDTARLTHKLTYVIGAERQATGLRDPDTVLEIWVTGHNGNWVIVQTYSNGTSCIVAMGEHWDSSKAPPA